ncbi:hypothetical protein [Micropruina sp.]|uniref:hypothetical protein n=1 Tax=Micropruina sp. TaxID=2737536 RepID=UPI0039E27D09
MSGSTELPGKNLKRTAKAARLDAAASAKIAASAKKRKPAEPEQPAAAGRKVRLDRPVGGAIDGIPVQRQPVENQPVERTPVERVPVERIPVERIPERERPVGGGQPLDPGRGRLPVGGLKPVLTPPVLDPRVPIDRLDPIWRVPIHLPDLGDLAVPPAQQIEVEHSFEVIRSSDLVSLIVSTSGFDLDAGTLTARDPGPALLIFTLPFQHLGEQATYEGETVPVPNESKPTEKPTNVTDPSDGVPPTPVGGIPARASRLVVTVPAGDTVEVSTTGFLDALARYPMAVHPLATAGPARTATFTTFDPGKLAVLVNAGLLDRAVLAGAAPPPMAEVHAADTTTGVAQLARTLADVRKTLGGPAATVSISKLVVDPRIVAGPILIPRNPQKLSRPAGLAETAIEAPFRLVISPSSESGWTHADQPVPDGSGTAVELWHTRLGHRQDDGVVEGPEWIRAVWARDRERFPNWATTEFGHDNVPMRMSLDSKDRHMIVRQSSETWARNRVKITDPAPIDGTRLYLSSLGAWLDLHAQWQTLPWSQQQPGMASILSWDHEAPMGRDQYVRVAYPGYLFPFGHRATLVKVTERKIKDKANPRAALYQRKFLIVGEPVKTYAARNLPFTRVEIVPTITPTLSPDPGAAQDTFFVPNVGGAPFQFVLHCLDADGREVKLPTPLVWVAEHFKPPFPANNDPVKAFSNLGETNGLGQSIAFAPSEPGGVDNSVPTVGLSFTGTPQLGTSVPSLVTARATIPAVERMKPTGPQQIKYAQAWLDNGFEAGNTGQVWAELTSPTTLGFGTGGTSTGGAGGFIAPSLPIEGLSRKAGPVGDLANTATGGFDPKEFLANALPKLFGFISLIDILDAVGVDLNDAPSLVTESLAKVEALMADLKELKQAITDAAAQAQQALTQAQQTADDLVEQGRNALANEVLAKANDALSSAQDLVNQVIVAADGVLQAIIDAPGDLANAPGKLAAALSNLAAALTTVEAAAAKLTPLAKNRLTSLTTALRTAASDVEMVQSVIDFVQGIATAVTDARFSFKWQPKLQSWPNENKPVLQLPERGLTLAVEGQAGAHPKADVLAELRGFALILPPGEPMAKLPFDHLSFKAGSSGKVEVDAAVGNIEFVGILSFVERIKQLIPLDGFSDPPYVDVSPEGVVAGFTLELPNLAIGVFSLSNMSLSADVRVPFLGDIVSVGFGFCTRERPFNLAVLCLGGGGWFGIRLSPRGLEVLELGLEAGAYLSINLGVASGSVSMALGLYLRMEADKGSLTAYFRLRGEVDVLGLISASIELYLSLTYDFPSGKLIGKAVITVKVKVLCFSASVEISCERKFAGSNGDPTFAEVMGVQPDFTSPLWSEYCLAFAQE